MSSTDQSAPFKKWLCIICGFIYDEAVGWPHDGIEAGTRWEDVPSDWLCPDCLVGKEDFEMIEMPAEPIKSGANITAAAMVEAASELPSGPIVIVGSGYAGYNLAEAIRKLDAQADIVVLTQDEGKHYSKPALSTGLNMQQSADDLVVELPLDRANRLNIRIVTHCSVERIDTPSKRLYTNLGQQPYGQLVLAQGAQAIQIPFEGDAGENVISVNSLEDYRCYRDLLQNKDRVLLIGNGLIGCEFANDLASVGKQVNVVGLTAWPMDRLLPEIVGRRLQDSLSAIGVNWWLDNTVACINYVNPANPNAGYSVLLTNGEELEVDVIVSAVGLQARTKLAIKSGITCGVGIKTDARLMTNVPHVYALGDCVEFDGQLQPFIAPIYWGIQALSNTLTGSSTEVSYPQMTVVVKTPACPITLLPPASGIQGQWQLEQDEKGMVARFINDKGQVCGFVLQGDRVDQRKQLLSLCETQTTSER
ncbi:MAG: FAD-dependent oxidoreductase [Gammaproteobacteria bacterium]|nr:FAD-dependent oxidoreductase [Gammaproteobacteria bacterium]